MLQIDVVTLFPDMFKVITEYGVTGRAVDNGLIKLTAWNPRDFTQDKHRTVDDRPYGGGPGMVMLVAPLRDAIYAARKSQGQEGSRVVCLSPQGRRLDHDGVHELSQHKGIVLVAGRYEGIDERIIELEVDEEWSIGDYVLSGGELAAMVMIDAIARTIPGVLGHADSAREDSFCGGLLDYPHYTRPEEIDGKSIPAVLASGNHEEIRRWRLKQALGRTWLRRPDLLVGLELDAEQQALLEEYKSEFDSSEGQE
jgi:tRNA (guanine37-N1)-methyltransferase